MPLTHYCILSTALGSPQRRPRKWPLPPPPQMAPTTISLAISLLLKENNDSPLFSCLFSLFRFEIRVRTKTTPYVTALCNISSPTGHLPFILHVLWVTYWSRAELKVHYSSQLLLYRSVQFVICLLICYLHFDPLHPWKTHMNCDPGLLASLVLKSLSDQGK